MVNEAQHVKDQISLTIVSKITGGFFHNSIQFQKVIMLIDSRGEVGARHLVKLMVA